MIVIRYALSDPSKSELRSALLEDHKRHIRQAPFKILLSGPAFSGCSAGAAAAFLVAKVATFDQLERFDANDPYVTSAVYSSTKLYEWRASFGDLLECLQE